MKDAEGNEVSFRLLLEFVPRMTDKEIEMFLKDSDSSERFKRLLRQELMRRQYDNHRVQDWQPVDEFPMY